MDSNKFKRCITFFIFFKCFTCIFLVTADCPLSGHTDKPDKKYTLKGIPQTNALRQLPGTDQSSTTPTSNYKKAGTQLIKGHEARRQMKKRTTMGKVHKRTIPHRVSLEEECDYLAKYCMRAYATGTLCGRTLYYRYHNFTNYCMLDYVNCMERYEVWQVVHMGDCFEITPLSEYLHYPYQDDFFLDQYYVLDDS